MTKPRSESRQKTELIQVRATPEEKAQLKARAAAFGISVGALCRQTIFGAKPKSTVDLAAIQELAVTRADLGRIGGLLKGWLGDSFPNAPRPDVVEVRALLKQIQQGEDAVLVAVKNMINKKS